MSVYDVESLYGNYRSRTFSQIYPDEAAFVNNYKLAIPSDYDDYTVSSTEAKLIYYLLYSRYGNSSIASSDENRFKFQVSSMIFQYGPLWLKKLEIQKTLRALTESDITSGSLMIANHAYNPSTSPNTTDEVILNKIDQQSTNRWRKSKLEGYENLMMLLDQDATEDFLKKFRKLFIQVVEPELPLWYANYNTED